MSLYELNALNLAGELSIEVDNTDASNEESHSSGQVSQIQKAIEVLKTESAKSNRELARLYGFNEKTFRIARKRMAPTDTTSMVNEVEAEAEADSLTIVGGELDEPQLDQDPQPDAPPFTHEQTLEAINALATLDELDYPVMEAKVLARVDKSIWTKTTLRDAVKAARRRIKVEADAKEKAERQRYFEEQSKIAEEREKERRAKAEAEAKARQEEATKQANEANPSDKSAVKRAVVNQLLSNVEQINLFQKCLDLGWYPRSEKDSGPDLVHYKVAIVDGLIEVAKKHNWHLTYHGYFYIYTGCYWLSLDDEEMKQLVMQAAIYMSFPIIDARNADFVDKLFKQSIRDGFFNKSHDGKQSIINLKNGSLWITEHGAILREFNHCDFVTHQLEFNYDPEAVNTLWQGYLDRVQPNKDTQRTLQQMAGFMFVKGLKLELIFFLFGTGSNGKSVFYEVLNGILGEDNVSGYSLEGLTDDSGYTRAKIKDKLVNFGTDVRLTKLNVAHFKTMASQEPIQARLPFKEPFMMTDYAKLIFNVNELNSAQTERTHGFFRKILIIPFNQTIPEEEQDKDFHKKILENKSGVLNWVIEGAEEIVKNRSIFISDECREAGAKFKKESDSVALFEDHIQEELMRDGRYSETVKHAHDQYEWFCMDAGHKYPLGRKNFSERMVALGFTRNKAEQGTMLEKEYPPKPEQTERPVNKTASWDELLT